MINSFIKTIFAVCFSVIFITITFTTYGFGQTNSGQLFNGLKARSIGPSSMGGRITAVEALESNPFVIYVGAASGGVWKSENGGQTWNSIFDENDNLIGIIGLHVDDFIHCGTEKFVKEILLKIMAEFTVGKSESGNFMYTGFMINQDATGISLDQAEYVEGIEIPTLKENGTNR